MRRIGLAVGLAGALFLGGLVAPAGAQREAMRFGETMQMTVIRAPVPVPAPGPPAPTQEALRLGEVLVPQTTIQGGTRP